MGRMRSDICCSSFWENIASWTDYWRNVAIIYTCQQCMWSYLSLQNYKYNNLIIVKWRKTPDTTQLSAQILPTRVITCTLTESPIFLFYSLKDDSLFQYKCTDILSLVDMCVKMNGQPFYLQRNSNHIQLWSAQIDFPYTVFRVLLYQANAVSAA